VDSVHGAWTMPGPRWNARRHRQEGRQSHSGALSGAWPPVGLGLERGGQCIHFVAHLGARGGEVAGRGR
jgi:hypothetical protein